MRKKPVTSWQSSQKWYKKSVGLCGNYYHQHVILPNLLRLMNARDADSILDLGCGQGILERALPKNCTYIGIDASPSLIEFAHKNARSQKHEFMVADATKRLPQNRSDFSHAVFLLSLQNMENAQSALMNTANYLRTGGRLYIVLNHPCFRIPRQSSWQIDEEKKIEYRRIDRYLSPLKIPVSTNPGSQERSPLTWSFHNPLSDYFGFLRDAGLLTETVEEWASDKESEGKAARMENRARAEFPLFLTLVAKKG